MLCLRFFHRDSSPFSLRLLYRVRYKFLYLETFVCSSFTTPNDAIRGSIRPQRYSTSCLLSLIGQQSVSIFVADVIIAVTRFLFIFFYKTTLKTYNRYYCTLRRIHHVDWNRLAVSDPQEAPGGSGKQQCLYRREGTPASPGIGNGCSKVSVVIDTGTDNC